MSQIGTKWDKSRTFKEWISPSQHALESETRFDFFFQKKIDIGNLKKKDNLWQFGNFLTFNWQFSGGSGVR